MLHKLGALQQEVDLRRRRALERVSEGDPGGVPGRAPVQLAEHFASEGVYGALHLTREFGERRSHETSIVLWIVILVTPPRLLLFAIVVFVFMSLERNIKNLSLSAIHKHDPDSENQTLLISSSHSLGRTRVPSLRRYSRTSSGIYTHGKRGHHSHPNA